MPATINGPTYTVELGLTGSGPAATFVTIAGVREIHIKRGRQDELGTVEAGTCTVLLNNGAGNLSPENASSPYTGNVLPLRPLRVTATWQSVSYVLFRGFVESYTPVDNGPLDADMQITAVDWFKLANTFAFSVWSRAVESDGTRVSAVFSAVGAYGLATAVDLGQTDLCAITLDQTSALQHLQDICTATRGIVFCARDGTLTYHTRYHRQLVAASMSVQTTFGQPDATTHQYPASTFPFAGWDYSLDDRDIYNDVRVTSLGTGAATPEVIVRSNTTSQSAYGPRQLLINTNVLAVGEARGVAEYLTALYPTPFARLHGITLDLDAETGFPGLVAQGCAREIGDRIHVAKARPGALGVSRDYWIEGVAHDITTEPGDHTVRWQLSDCRLGGPIPWVLGSTALDSTDILAF